MSDLTVTVMKEGNKCRVYFDKFYDTDDKFALTAELIKFRRRALFTRDSGDPVFDILIEDAKKMAREILEL